MEALKEKFNKYDKHLEELRKTLQEVIKRYDQGLLIIRDFSGNVEDDIGNEIDNTERICKILKVAILAKQNSIH